MHDKVSYNCAPRRRILKTLPVGSSQAVIFAECSPNECTIDICLVESIIHFNFIELSPKLELIEYTVKLSMVWFISSTHFSSLYRQSEQTGNDPWDMEVLRKLHGMHLVDDRFKIDIFKSFRIVCENRLTMSIVVSQYTSHSSSSGIIGQSCCFWVGCSISQPLHFFVHFRSTSFATALI